MIDRKAGGLSPIMFASKKQSLLTRLWLQRQRQMMVIPGIVFIVIFSYIPMYGILMAFKEYDIFLGFEKSRWVGFRQFQMLFSLPDFPSIIRNTLLISFLKLLVCFPAPILLAVLLNEVTNMKFKRTVQTISYLPHFMSWVIVAGFAFEIFSMDWGTVNTLLLNLGLIKEPIAFFMSPDHFYGIVVLTELWKEVGWGAIIYIAAISGIDPTLYEAAVVDGAGRLQRIIHITLPSIAPTIVILLIFAISGLLNAGFDQILLLSNTTLTSVSEILDTYVYRVGIQQGRYSLATAAGLFKSGVSLLLLVGANFAARKLNQESLF